MCRAWRQSTSRSQRRVDRSTEQAERIKELEADLLEWKIAHSTVTVERDALKAELEAQVNELEMWKVKRHNAQLNNSKILDAFHQRNEEQAEQIKQMRYELVEAERRLNNLGATSLSIHDLLERTK